jgi:hypothetical protein
MTYRVSSGAAAVRVALVLIASALPLFGGGCDNPGSSPLAPDKSIPDPIPHGSLPPLGQHEWVPNQLVIRVSSEWTIEEVHERCRTYTLAGIPAERTYLVGCPPGTRILELADYMLHVGYCYAAEPNYLLETPESEQKSLAFYEGSFGHEDYMDQGALSRVGASMAHQISAGKGVLVAVIDTGIDRDHPDLVARIHPAAYDFIDGDGLPDDLPNQLDDDRNNYVDEATGHGTHVAGIVAAVAPGAQIMPLRVLDSDGTGTVFAVAEAIYHADQYGAQIINLSLGLTGGSDAIERAIERAHGDGIVVVSSAGNRGIRDEQHFPARLPEVIAVAATDAADRKADFSNYGSHISVSAPGVGIMSTYWNGGYALWSGTSMSVPFIAGAAALRISIDPRSPGDIQQLIEDTSADLQGDCPDPFAGLMGEGRVDLYSLVVIEPQVHVDLAP